MTSQYSEHVLNVIVGYEKDFETLVSFDRKMVIATHSLHHTHTQHHFLLSEREPGNIGKPQEEAGTENCQILLPCIDI